MEGQCHLRAEEPLGDAGQVRLGEHLRPEHFVVPVKPAQFPHRICTWLKLGFETPRDIATPLQNGAHPGAHDFDILLRKKSL